MSDANRTRISIVEESSFGVTPATPNMEPLRVTGASLSSSPKTTQSNQLRADRNIADLIRTGFESGGSLPFEVSYGALDTLIEGIMYSVWVLRYNTLRNVNGGTPIASIGGTTDVNFTGTPFTPAVGELYRLSGFANAANNGVFEAVAGSTSSILRVAGGLVGESTAPVGARIKKVGYRSTTGDYVLTVTGGTAVLSGSNINNGTLGLMVPGEWVRLGGALTANQYATAANNGWYRVGSYNGSSITFDITPPGVVTDIGAGKRIDIFLGDYVRNGVTPKSYTVEQSFLDLPTPEHHMFPGARLDSLALSARAQEVLTATAALVSAGAPSILTTRTAGAVDLPIAGFDVMHASVVAGFILDAGVQVAAPNYVMGAALNINANTRRNPAMNTPGSIAIGAGSLAVTGSLSTYYGDKTLLTKLRNNQATSLVLMFASGDGTLHEAVLVDLPKVKYAAGDPTVPGINTDRMLDLGFQGLVHPTLGYTIHIQRFEGFTQ